MTKAEIIDRVLSKKPISVDIEISEIDECMDIYARQECIEYLMFINKTNVKQEYLYELYLNNKNK